jgi:hypothetical protein
VAVWVCSLTTRRLKDLAVDLRLLGLGTPPMQKIRRDEIDYQIDGLAVFTSSRPIQASRVLEETDP